MDVHDVLSVSATILASLGGGGFLVVALSSWLGKLWAERLMSKERRQFEKELKSLESEYKKSVSAFELTLRDELEDRASKSREKLHLYKEAGRPLIAFIMHSHHHGVPKLGTPEFLQWEVQRMEITALLAMFASADVFNKYNDVLDYLIECIESERKFVFSEVRILGLVYLNAVRRDIGLHVDAVSYQGRH